MCRGEREEAPPQETDRGAPAVRPQEKKKITPTFWGSQDGPFVLGVSSHAG